MILLLGFVVVWWAVALSWAAVAEVRHRRRERDVVAIDEAWADCRAVTERARQLQAGAITLEELIADLSGRTWRRPEVVRGQPTEELAFSGGGELWALTLGALGLIGFGRWVEWHGRRRAERR